MDKMLYRLAGLRRNGPQTLDEENRTVEAIASTETPCRIFDFERGGWIDEVLIADGVEVPERVALLDSHERASVQNIVGSALNFRAEGGQVVCTLQFSATADDAFKKAKEGHLTDVSVGYTRTEREYISANETKSINGRDYSGPIVVVTGWKIRELSICPIGADEGAKIRSKHHQEKEEEKMFETDQRTEEKAPKTPNINIDAERANAQEMERKRVSEIMRLSEKWGDRDGIREASKKAIESGDTLEAFQRSVLDIVATPVDPKSAFLDMSERDMGKYSLVRAIYASAEKDWSKAPFERECSDAAAQRLGKDPRGFIVPPDIAVRDMTAGTPTAGGNLIDTTLRTGSMIELLRDALVTRALGVQVLSGLVGNFAVPKITGGTTTYHVAENEDVTKSDMGVGQIAMTPHTIGARTHLSRQLLIQTSPDVEQMVKSDMMDSIAAGIDQQALHGTGLTVYPLGLAANTDVPTVSIDTDGGAITRAKIVELETTISVANANNGRMAYLTNAKVKGDMKLIDYGTDTGRYLWGENGQVNGYRAVSSNLVASDLTKGAGTALSAMFFGKWRDMILGFWSGIDVTTDPYSLLASGQVRVVTFQDYDVAVRHGESFAKILDIVTTA